ncbi:unnamed protein product [Candida verbasci]|uniref:Uncharacterized protein n=1 Tax=Candida verbasci TaxID=1227364 RepID=A0A9W4TQR8_9ASCO|nr:unnamed protein product [Candida verbasci]
MLNPNNIIAITLAPTSTILAKRDDETSTSMPRNNMPTLSDPNAYTTPSISVPANDNNPYIVRQYNPSGTVFIAVGSIVGAILLGFILYHLILSIAASRLAKRVRNDDKKFYEKYQNNNHSAYGLTPQSTLFTTEYHNHHSSISKLPLLNQTKSFMGNFGNNGSQHGDTSTIYQSEYDNNVATSKHDLTKMFISPTAEVMQHKRVKSYNPSLSNISLGNIGGGSTSNLVNPSPATNRHSQLVPNLYINNEGNNSDYSLSQQLGSEGSNTPQMQQQNNLLNTTKSRRQLPSMYLEDLIDKE